MVTVDSEILRVRRDDATIESRKTEVRAASIHAIDTIVDGIVRYLTLDHESGEYVEWSERDDDWRAVIATVPAFVGFDATTLDAALARARPDEEPIVAFER